MHIERAEDKVRGVWCIANAPTCSIGIINADERELPILVVRTADSRHENCRFPLRELPILIVRTADSRDENCRFSLRELPILTAKTADSSRENWRFTKRESMILICDADGQRYI